MSGRLLGSIGIAASLLTACVSLGPSAVPARTASYTLDADPEQVLDAALAVAISPELSLKVQSLDREKNTAEFKHAQLSPDELESVCIYPGVKDDQPDAWQNFQSWSLDSVREGVGPVSGYLDLSMQVSAASGGGSEVSTRTTVSAGTEADRVHCRSRGVLESEFQNALEAQLGL